MRNLCEWFLDWGSRSDAHLFAAKCLVVLCGVTVVGLVGLAGWLVVRP